MRYLKNVGASLLKRINREIVFIAHVFDCFPSGEIDLSSYLDSLNECNLIEMLKKNKVAVNFERNLETSGVPRKKFLCKFPCIKVFYEGVHAKIEKDLREFDRIKDKFCKDGIEFMLIKSNGLFPYESDNLDILIKPNKLGKVTQILRNAGYSERIRIREPHKFLFRKTSALKELALHIHTRVEWEGTQFVNSKNLWRRRKVAEENNNFFVPSSEDSILITIAHLFFENHEIKLDDLIKVDSCIRKWSIDWDYIFNHAQRLHWGDALHLTLLLLNLKYKDLYRRNMLPDGVLLKMSAHYRYYKLFLNIMKHFSFGPTLFKIPYIIASLFFVRRVILNINLSLAERLKHLRFIIFDVAKRKIRACIHGEIL